MAVQECRLYTHAEYFALEKQADYKSDYYQGKIIALEGGSLNHNRIAGNVHTALNIALEDKSCELSLAMSGFGLRRRISTPTLM